MKRLLPLLCALLLLSACGPALPEETDRLQIAAAVFPAYDFARAAAGGRADVTLLLPPGAESHSYEPTPADILAVEGCDLFVYLGGVGPLGGDDPGQRGLPGPGAADGGLRGALRGGDPGGDAGRTRPPPRP